MAAPQCPPGYTCTFTPIEPPETGPWWQVGDAGPVLTGLAIVGVVVMVCVLVYWVAQTRKAARDAQSSREARELEERTAAATREHELAIEEQRTMQIDSAQGNPEVVRLVRDMQRPSR